MALSGMEKRGKERDHRLVLCVSIRHSDQSQSRSRFHKMCREAVRRELGRRSGLVTTDLLYRSCVRFSVVAASSYTAKVESMVVAA